MVCKSFSLVIDSFLNFSLLGLSLSVHIRLDLRREDCLLLFEKACNVGHQHNGLYSVKRALLEEPLDGWI